MAVYTKLADDVVASFLTQYAIGPLTALQGISDGIENTNYLLKTVSDEFVLTLFEHHNADEVASFVRLARHLGQAGLAVPMPLDDIQGVWLHELSGKPAILCRRLPGTHTDQLTSEHCAEIGRGLAQLHLAAQDLPQRRVDERGFDWWLAIAPELKANLSPADQALLEAELQAQKDGRTLWCQLPHGWIHADLFHDNALFLISEQGTKLTAILDLYNACDGALAYDLAIVANDWCREKNGIWDKARLTSLLASYESVRPVTTEEKMAWPLLLRGAALRFWLSRLLAQRLATQQGRTLPADKNPDEYRRKLQQQQQQQ